MKASGSQHQWLAYTAAAKECEVDCCLLLNYAAESRTPSSAVIFSPWGELSSGK